MRKYLGVFFALLIGLSFLYLISPKRQNRNQRVTVRLNNIIKHGILIVKLYHFLTSFMLEMRKLVEVMRQA